MNRSKNDAPLNQVACPHCGKHVHDQAVGCPACGEKINVNLPGDMTPTKHPPVQFPDETDRT